MEMSTFLEYQENDTQNVQSVKKLYQKLKEGDSTAISKLLVDDPTWHVCPGFPHGGTYRSVDKVFGLFYLKLRNRFYYFDAEPDVFIDGGDVVTVLGFYKFMVNDGDPVKPVRFSHTWKITSNGRIKGVWQVADSSQFIIKKDYNDRLSNNEMESSECPGV